MTPHGLVLADTIAQLLVTLAFLGLGYAGWLALGTVVDDAVQPMADDRRSHQNRRRTRTGRKQDRRDHSPPGRARRIYGSSKCNECGQQLTYVVMVDTGRRVPVDPWPVADGNVCARKVGGKLEGYVIAEKRPASGMPGFRRYAAHFGTCPDRARPGKARKPKPAPPPTLFDGLDP